MDKIIILITLALLVAIIYFLVRSIKRNVTKLKNRKEGTGQMFNFSEDFKTAKQSMQNYSDKSTIWQCTTTELVGNIPEGAVTYIQPDPKANALRIKPMSKKFNEVTIPYERLQRFHFESEEALKSNSGLGGAVVGGVLFGGVGAIVGQQASKGKKEIVHYGVLDFEGKDGKEKRLIFRGKESKVFADKVNEIVARYHTAVTEL